jgi:hypothetical protein
MLRHCIMQMQHQSYPVDHAIYVNSSEPDDHESTTLGYDILLNDVVREAKGRVLLSYGESRPYHQNYVRALAQTNIDDYDLFLKVDDDDIYLTPYVETVVADFVANGWDYSGSHARSVLNGKLFLRNTTWKDLGMGPEDVALNVPHVMPPTVALSRRAVRAILAMEDSGTYEDIQWRRALASNPEFVLAVRDDSNFIYHVHGANVSTASFLRPQDASKPGL